MPSGTYQWDCMPSGTRCRLERRPHSLRGPASTRGAVPHAPRVDRAGQRPDGFCQKSGAGHPLLSHIAAMLAIAPLASGEAGEQSAWRAGGGQAQRAGRISARWAAPPAGRIPARCEREPARWTHDPAGRIPAQCEREPTRWAASPAGRIPARERREPARWTHNPAGRTQGASLLWTGVGCVISFSAYLNAGLA